MLSVIQCLVSGKRNSITIRNRRRTFQRRMEEETPQTDDQVTDKPQQKDSIVAVAQTVRDSLVR